MSAGEGAPPPGERMTIVFACVHNAGRSQMAAAFLRQAARRAGRDVTAISAGTTPGDRVHPEVITAMQEVGIDLSAARPQHLTAALLQDAQRLVTMGCGEACPYVPGLATEDWPLEDPKGRPLPKVREIRDEIRARVEDLLQRI